MGGKGASAELTGSSWEMVVSTRKVRYLERKRCSASSVTSSKVAVPAAMRLHAASMEARTHGSTRPSSISA